MEKITPEIWREAIRRCENMARGYSLRSPSDYDSLLSAGYLGLTLALESFDPTKGASFITWSYNTIRAAMKDEITQQTRETRGRKDMDPMDPMDKDNSSSPWEQIAANLTGVDELLIAHDIVDQLRDPVEREVFIRYTLQDETFEEIAESMKLASRSHAHYLYKNACAKLRKHLSARA